MHFHEWNLHRQQGIPQHNTGVRITRRVEDDEVDFIHGALLDDVDQFPFAVVLPVAQFMPAGRRKALQVLHDFLQAAVTVTVRFPAAEQVEVGSIDNPYLGHRYSR